MTASWPLRIALARFRPFGAAAVVKVSVVGVVFALFLAGDYALFRRLFRAIAQIESLSPFFAIGLLQNLLGMVLLVAIMVLFFSALTAAIGAFFSDFDLEIYHAAPRGASSIALARLGKTFVQSSYLVGSFLVPIFVALAAQYGQGIPFLGSVVVHLALLLSIPVALASSLIIVLIRFFPVRRVHQITLTLAIFLMTLVVVGFRMMRPERLFATIDTDDLARVLQAIEIPAARLYPSGWFAEVVVSGLDGKGAPVESLALVGAALACLAVFLVVSRSYHAAFVRARESLAPVAIGGGGIVKAADRIVSKADPQTRAMIAKEIRVLTRDVAQWSQLFMMIALLFLYLYNIRTLPLEGDVRAILVAYLNLGMAGFVVSAICLRFAYPSVSAEGRSFWMLQTAPISYGKFLWVKCAVFGGPLVLVSMFLTAAGNVILQAPPLVWGTTMTGSILIAAGLVTLGVGMGGAAPRFSTENPLEIGLSLGGLAYMAVSMLYVGVLMVLMARPIQRFAIRMIFGVGEESSLLWRAGPVLLAVLLAGIAIALPIEVARRRLSALARTL